jgi:DNA-binding NtrC family response regulator
LEPDVRGLNILVIDDDHDVCRYLEDLLGGDGHAVTSIHDPTRAEVELRDRKYHVVILDLMMPKMSGIDLLARIRKIDDDVAVVILTGFPSLDSATRSIEHDVSAYIQKPFSADGFRAVLSRISQKKGLCVQREDELHQCIGQSIRDLRKERGLTLKQMARRTDLSVSLLSQIERAESSASVSSLFKVATALDVPITAFFGEF